MFTKDTASNSKEFLEINHYTYIKIEHKVHKTKMKMVLIKS